MNIAVISIGRSGSSELISILEKKKFNVIKKPYNHLYPNELKKMFGENIKVIFISRNITDILVSIKNKELTNGIKWVEEHYKNLNSNFQEYHNMFIKDTFNFEKLFDSYINNKMYSTLFINYEDLYINNTSECVNILNKFLNTNSFIKNDFDYNKNNKWSTKKNFILNNDILNKNKEIFSSLTKKINENNLKIIN